ncbi:MAG: response regulator [Enterobacterales bacterium]|nr:response regulator [Enterobacterales bacterium]
MQALGTLVGGIAHDFNNMLAGITGNIYLAKKLTQDKPNVVEKLTNAEDLSFRAAEMIKQLLTFARKDRVNMKLFALNSFINETIKLIQSSIPENITVIQEISDEVIHISGDKSQIHQILLNLINNACDAVAQEDAPRITIRLEVLKVDKAYIKKHPSAQAGDYAHLSVADNGPGIPENNRARVFEPFYTTKDVGKGTGLGLAMVFGAMKNHHGFVEVDGIENEGSIFNIYLPLMDPQIAETSSNRNNVNTTQGLGETILLVDDEADVVDTGKHVLRSMGYRVMTAINGQQAVAMYKEHSGKIDLIVMDVIMPVLSGDKAAKQIREINPAVKIIFATGYDKGAQIETENEVVISKPFAIEKMSALIRKTIDS